MWNTRDGQSLFEALISPELWEDEDSKADFFDDFESGPGLGISDQIWTGNFGGLHFGGLMNDKFSLQLSSSLLFF